MGLFTNEIIFDYPAPKLDRIIKEIENISGLPVVEVDLYSHDSRTDNEEYKYDADELYVFYQHIAFKDFPKYSILIYAYIPNGVNQLVEKEKLETSFDANWPQPCHGADEEEGKQTIHIETHVGTETTLFLATTNALLSLCGESRYEKSISNALDKYPVQINELKNNHKKVKRKILFNYLLLILKLPIIIPIALVKMVISIIKMPFEINTSMKAVKKHYPKENNKE